MSGASAGISASTSRGVKWRSATDRRLDEDRVHLLRPVHAARERQLDIRRPARAGDEADDGSAGPRRTVGVPELEEHAGLRERLDERRPVEERDVVGRQERRRARSPAIPATTGTTSARVATR